MNYIVMGVNDWPEDGQEDFVVCNVHKDESFEDALKRAKNYYDDVEFYIEDENGVRVY